MDSRSWSRGRLRLRRKLATITTFPTALPFLSLPLQPQSHRGEVVANWFDNLLPESDDVRRRLRAAYRVEVNDPFDLLAQLGRDCIGAVQLYPDYGLPPDVTRITARELNETQVADAIRRRTNSNASPLAAGHDNEDDFRISLAGMQEKTALLKLDDCRWAEPLGTTPTTHIFKPPLGTIGPRQIDLGQSVENEWLCAQLTRELGVPTASCSIASFEDQKVLIVERFDRRLSEDDSWWMRLPQEDFCQALGVPGVLKYQNDGGPSIEQSMDLLRGSQRSFVDRKMFFRANLIFFLLAASDGHGKNFSIAIKRFGGYTLTPLYDILSAYPVMGGQAGQIHPRRLKMAMSAAGTQRGNEYHWYKLRRAHWIATGRRCGVSERWTNTQIDELIASIEPAIEAISVRLPDRFPALVADSIFDGLRQAGVRLAE